MPDRQHKAEQDSRDAPRSVTTRARLDELEAVLEDGKRLIILTHDNPDPDALASAYALLKLVESFNGLPARMAFGGIVGRAENRTMVRELELPLTPARDLVFDDSDLVAVVDSQPGTGNNSLPAGRAPTIVIDHHALRPETNQAKFFDVRPGLGATCTIMTEYLQAAGIPLEGALATALFYGIQSETQDLGRESTHQDLDAIHILSSAADRRMISRIRYPKLSPAYFTSLHRSLERARTRGAVVISHLGNLDYPDLVAELADFYLRREGATWSICVGRFGDDMLISIRTTLQDAAAGELLRRVVGADGDAGGHGMIAGARIPLGGLSEEDARLKGEEVVNRFVKELGMENEAGSGLLGDHQR
ncbi:MAG: DHH family phosphoesterase [Gemmatimonadota bacterium]|nr:DHH family phosphoesterase [Candidatus Palauibacterales bacterium]